MGNKISLNVIVGTKMHTVEPEKRKKILGFYLENWEFHF